LRDFGRGRFGHIPAGTPAAVDMTWEGGGVVWRGEGEEEGGEVGCNGWRLIAVSCSGAVIGDSVAMPL